MDWDRVLALAGQHWEIVFWALVLFRYIYPAHSHYVPARVWDDLIGRFIAAVKTPDPKAQFRGSLIDENQFAIDVNEWRMADLLSELREERIPKLECPVEERKAS